MTQHSGAGNGSEVRKLRVLHVLVKPILVWDDGDELCIGPDVNPVELSPAQLLEFVAKLPESVDALASQLNGSSGVALPDDLPSQVDASVVNGEPLPSRM